MRYHLGSIALGSFIVAVVQFIRAILEYVDKKTKRLQDTNPVVKFFMCCVKYCVWYLEQVLQHNHKPHTHPRNTVTPKLPETLDSLHPKH